jgi:hypothetical protein
MDNDDFTLGGLPDPRIATRYVARIRVIARFGERELEGSIVDLSNSGARLEIAAISVQPGTLVRLELPWFPSEQPASMLAKYVRKTDTGCALRFSDPDPFLRVFVKLGLLQNQAGSEPRVATAGTRF